MSDCIIERLRHHAKDERNTAFARSTMREAEQELSRVTAQRGNVSDRLRASLDDPMWADHAEISKSLLRATLLEIDSLRAELAASREREARMQWQPIDTAPRDGSYVLVSNGHGVWVARFKDVYQSGWKPPSPWQSMMLNHDHIPSAKRSGNPTQWKPLPTALAEGAQG